MTESVPPENAERSAGFAALYDRHSREVWSMAYARRMDAAQAQDVMQETFLRYWKHLEADGEPIQNPRAWLLRVARNLAEDYAKSAFRRNGTQGPEVFGGIMGRFDNPGDRMEAEETFAKLRTELRELSVGDRDILVLRYAFEYETEQIADVLGIQASAVHMRLSRARQRLADQLKAKGWKAES